MHSEFVFNRHNFTLFLSLAIALYMVFSVVIRYELELLFDYFTNYVQSVYNVHCWLRLCYLNSLTLNLSLSNHSLQKQHEVFSYFICVLLLFTADERVFSIFNRFHALVTVENWNKIIPRYQLGQLLTIKKKKQYAEQTVCWQCMRCVRFAYCQPELMKKYD